MRPQGEDAGLPVGLALGTVELALGTVGLVLGMAVVLLLGTGCGGTPELGFGPVEQAASTSTPNSATRQRRITRCFPLGGPERGGARNPPQRNMSLPPR